MKRLFQLILLALVLGTLSACVPIGYYRDGGYYGHGHSHHGHHYDGSHDNYHRYR